MPKYMVFAMIAPPNVQLPDPLSLTGVMTTADSPEAAVEKAVQLHSLPVGDGDEVNVCDLTGTQTFILSAFVSVESKPSESKFL